MTKCFYLFKMKYKFIFWFVLTFKQILNNSSFTKPKRFIFSWVKTSLNIWYIKRLNIKSFKSFDLKDYKPLFVVSILLYFYEKSIIFTFTSGLNKKKLLISWQYLMKHIFISSFINSYIFKISRSHNIFCIHNWNICHLQSSSNLNLFRFFNLIQYLFSSSNPKRVKLFSNGLKWDVNSSITNET